MLLTGTPVQNALGDLWALMDFAQPGVLGNHATFVKEFSEKIEKGSVKEATPFQAQLKKHLANQLRNLIAPHLLRRTKAEAGLIEGVAPGDADAVPEEEAPADEARMAKLPPKKETIVWLSPTEEQTSAYHKILEKSDVIKQACSKSKLGVDVFVAIGLLKRLCNHPTLVLPTAKTGQWNAIIQEAQQQFPKTVDSADAPDPFVSADGVMETSSGDAAAVEAEDTRAGRIVELAIRKLPRSAEAMLNQSAKLKCLASLLPALAKRGHRTLVFSQSVKMLDLIQICVLRPSGLRSLRIDGSTDAVARGQKVDKFNRHTDRFQVMLLTTHVGGVGLNLTSADRVVMMDPAWNPAVDAQAVDRAFRIGQAKEVRVYRLIMSGLIEDKMFRLQVFKMGLANTALQAGSKSENYFSAREIKALFEWTDPAEGATRKMLQGDNGEDADDCIEELARDDGSDGWLSAGPAVGLSDFTKIYSGLTKSEETEDQGDACEAQLEDAQQKLGAADEKLQQKKDAKDAAKVHEDAVVKSLGEAKEFQEVLKDKMVRADKYLKERRPDFAQARKSEALAQQRLDKSERSQLSAQNQILRVESDMKNLETLAKIAVGQHRDSLSFAKSTDDSFQTVLAEVEAQLQVVDSNGRCAIATGVADANPAKTRQANKALEKVRNHLDANAAKQAELVVAEDELQRSIDELLKSEIANAQSEEASSKKAAELSVKNRQKDLQRADTAHGKAAQKAQVAREAMVEVFSTFVEAAIAFVETFVQTEARQVRKDQVKGAQAVAKAAFKSLGRSGEAARKARDSVQKASSTRRKAADKAAASAVSRAECSLVLAQAERELAAAKDENSLRREEMEASQEMLTAAETQRTAVEQEQEQCRVRIKELQASVPEAKMAVKAAATAEKEAAQERQSLHGVCSKVHKQQAQMEDSKSSALNILKSEDYDAQQVEKAYQAANGTD